MLTQDRVRELFDYRSDGVLIWKTRISRRVKVGTEAGFFDKYGYLSIKIAGKTYKTHRIVWMWHHGYFPEQDIDHTNRKPADNRIENLREVAHVCNSRNTRTYTTNTSGVKGVCWEKQRKKWAASIVVDSRTIHLAGYRLRDCKSKTR